MCTVIHLFPPLSPLPLIIKQKASATAPVYNQQTLWGGLLVKKRSRVVYFEFFSAIVRARDALTLAADASFDTETISL